ncbi:Y-family DNA polymerase [Lentibacter algarum]|uniref:Y-family DNA polymerase n=1 Tax=Lentibacter algarum TaxID=576131 RepID=UPI002090AAD8|nr:DNA polymerase Y family protein [Lentibacter algarum]
MKHIEGAFAVTAHIKNADRLVCLNAAAEEHGLRRGMGLADARSFCPSLLTELHDAQADQAFQRRLVRWAQRYCPWVGEDGVDGLFLDVTGSAHLLGGEAALLHDIRTRLARSRLTVSIGIADTPGAAWALAHFGQGCADTGDTLKAVRGLPVASLRITAKEDTTLQRLGIKTVGQLADLPRATVGQRFGASVLMRLDQALGHQAESISPEVNAPVYATRLTLPEPIGLAKDVMAGVERLLPPLCEKLMRMMAGVRVLSLSCRLVDGGAQTVELRLARPLRDPARILPLFERGIGEIDAGFGIDQLRLVAVQVEALPAEQTTQASQGQSRQDDGLHDLITRLGNRIGLENIQRFLPADSHIPERSFIIAPAAWSEVGGAWVSLTPRPVRLFPPEYVAASTNRPPGSFKWRGMSFKVGRVTGPERIAPEWWLEDENWRHGVRDYWKVETREGHRLWMFHTPQSPGWFVHGTFA